MREVVFEQFFCNETTFAPPKTTKSSFSCFVTFFEKVNTERTNLEGSIKARFKRLQEKEMEGTPTLWQIALTASNDEV